MLAYAINDDEPDIWLPSITPEAPVKLVTKIKEPKITKVAWNCGFERNIFRNQLHIDTPITEWIDPSVYARYMGLPTTLSLVSDYLKLGNGPRTSASGRASSTTARIPVDGREREYSRRTFHVHRPHETAFLSTYVDSLKRRPSINS